MNNNAIPTTFNDVRYRSRLEARWGAFFDLLKWEVYYEPFDLNGYIPDFIIHGYNERILVEVKPVTSRSDPLFKEAAAKIEKSGWEHEALIVSYFLPEGQFEVPGVGWLAEREQEWILEGAPFHDGGGLGLHHEIGSWRNRITGVHEGDYGTFSTDPRIERYWHEAGNAVQWRRP